MRKALIAIAVATALFAVGAFAASFTVNSEDIASGADPVTKCADIVDVDFVTVYDNDGDWDVASVEVTFFSGTVTPVATAACAGYGVNVAVMTSADGLGAPTETGESIIPAGTGPHVVTLTGTLKASDITRAAVLVDGENLQVATPTEGF